MGRIVIEEFGGITPSVDARRLGPAGAQTAKNLDLRFGDFRPLRGAGASVTTVPSGTVSLHRTPTGTWLSSTTDTNYVDAQQADTVAERVYLTGRQPYPEVWQGGSYRRLGVPRPPAAPTATVVAGDEFATDERTVAVRALVDSMYATAVAETTEVPLGGGVPGTALSPGALWLAHGTNAGLPTSIWRQVCYCVPITLGPIATVTASDSYLLDPALGGKAIVEASVNYWAVPFYWQARGYEFDEAAMETAYEALLKPPENTDPLFTPTEAAAAVQAIVSRFDATLEPAKAYIDQLDVAQTAVVTILSGTTTDAQRSFALANAQTTLKAASQRVEDYNTQTYQGLRSLVQAALGAFDYLVPAAVERNLETRSYYFTYVNDRDEESAPSDPCALLELDQNDTVQVTIGSPSVASPYGPLSKWRLYRSSTTNTGAAFAFVAEVAIGTLTYTDAKAQEDLGETCPTSTWVEPPSDLFALVGMPNGILAGLTDGGRALCFCEPGAQYAWPEEYRIPLQYPGVALGVFGQTVVVLTMGPPSYVSGSDSASMSEQKLESAQACVSKRSVVSTEGGVIYASPDGICIAGPGGVQLITTGAYSKEDWQALGLTTSFAAFSEGVYYLVTEN